ncbi:hypothetical protein GCM10009125_16200 [Castellaniella daejeonensis]|jgi:preprotein translocase subunit SecD|uniref:Lipoprotein n=1 Tax=Castellaniella daejeonensis TaxID=659013 RepID=A0ABN0TQZ9_9BURK|nr:hypothetical protein [Castellaniella sp.]HET8702485.1 hypothetical protein [Castellaniella sp.]
MRNWHSDGGPGVKLLAGAVLAVLAGCQAVPGPQGPANKAAAPSAAATAAPAQTAGPRHAITENRQAMDLRVFLADTRSRPDWTPVALKPSGVLYVRPTAIIGRDDLIGIQSATDQKGEGILVLILSDEGLRKMHEATAANPGLRLALVVGHTMLAAPGYAAPVSQQQLAFAVGSARNAELAARSVAGVESAPSAGGF